MKENKYSNLQGYYDRIQKKAKGQQKITYNLARRTIRHIEKILCQLGYHNDGCNRNVLRIPTGGQSC